MQELLKKLQDNVGLSPDQANKALDTVKTFIQDKLPAGLGINVDDILNGKMDISSLLSSFLGGGSAKTEEGDSKDNPLDKLKDMFS